MTNNMQVYTNEDFGSVRTLTINEEPWFVAKDICEALGIRTNTVRSILDDDEVSEVNVNSIDIGPEHGGKAPLIITEAGLYSLILRSRKPEAKAFKRWVTHEVLPSIRRDGGYIAAKPDESDDVIMARALLVAQKTIDRKNQLINGLTEDNARMLPKAVAYDSIMDSEGTYTVTQAARYLAQMGTKMTVKRLYALLRMDGLVCKRDNAPTKKAIQGGYAIQVMSTRPDGTANNPYARLTQKGVDWCITHYSSTPSQMRA